MFSDCRIDHHTKDQSPFHHAQAPVTSEKTTDPCKAFHFNLKADSHHPHCVVFKSIYVLCNIQLNV
jgi:hypothetical protein